MTVERRDLPLSSEFEELNSEAHPTSGTVDDDDNRDDEHTGENEAPIRDVDEATETSEEFEVDDEDEWSLRKEDNPGDDDDRSED